MEKRFGVYICTGCGIGDVIDAEKLSQVATGEFKVPICRTHSFYCSQEGIDQIRKDISEEGVNAVVIAACSPRVNNQVFSFDPTKMVFDRVNLREQVAWSHEPKPAEGEKFDEDIQMLAQDQVRMGIAKAQNMDPLEPFEGEISKRILVVGGGVTGMTSALEAAKAGYEVVLVEREPSLGGFATKLFKQYPNTPPYRELACTDYESQIRAVEEESTVKVYTSASIEKISGAPGMFDVSIRQNGNVTEERIGAVVLASGFEPYDATNLDHLGFGKSANVITSVTMEEMAARGSISRPSDGKTAESVAFIQCAGSRDPDHLPYCSTVCCMTSLKQAMYVREKNPDAKVYVFYKDIRTPGQYENFYRRVQEDEGVFLTKGEVSSVSENGDGSVIIEVDDTLLGEKISVKADLVVLATGMVPRTALGEEEVVTVEEEDEKKKDIASQLLTPLKIIKSNTLNLDYRQGPELPDLKYGFPDSHFICFPYETRRTGIYAAGPVRQPMDMAFSMEDARGAALKAIQSVEMVSVGGAVHPRSGDMSYPDLYMHRCTQCKRCTEECPFGMYNEDEKFNPLPNPTRCRRCAICMGSCPERIISFKDYTVGMISSMIKAVEVPEEEEEKPRILLLACENDAYPALDMVGLRRGRYNAYVRIIPLRCIGSVNLVWIADLLAKGLDGVLLLGCKHGEDYQCHFINGSELANYRMTKIQETLDRLVLESDRVRIEQIEISDYDRIPTIIDEFLETIEKVGPNPYKGL
ncbi:MAG: FAD-dependent oxidoreductase [Desulfobacterales bacterium]|nr:FAD-dependent oxidoreductase [Desulfobacterales bacterium]